MNSKKSFSVKAIVALGIGIALFFVLMRYVSIPSVLPNTVFGLQYAVTGLLAALFGPIIAALASFVGHMLNDMAAGWGVWWSWVIASGVVGLIMGIFMKNMKLDEGLFPKKDIFKFNLGVIIAQIISWIVIAPVLDILIYSEPANKVFAQGALAALNNIISTCIVGTLLCLAYAKAKPKEGSLREE